MKGLMCPPPTPQLSQDQGQNREALSAEEGRAGCGTLQAPLHLSSSTFCGPAVERTEGRGEGASQCGIHYWGWAGQRIS